MTRARLKASEPEEVELFHELALPDPRCFLVDAEDPSSSLYAYAQMLAEASERVRALADVATELDIGVVGLEASFAVDVPNLAAERRLVRDGVLNEYEMEDDEDDEDDEEGEDVAWICDPCGEVNPVAKTKCKDCGRKKPPTTTERR